MTVFIVAPTTVAVHGAKCLDGTPPAYTLRVGQGENASKFIVFMEGGGWCFSISDCQRRRGGGLGSSNDYKPGRTKPDLGGVMGYNSTTNPDFHSYTMVFVHYCDGTSFSSYREEPIPTTKGDPMWFRGKANLAAVFDELISTRGVGSATELILSGGSAGGLAVYYHLDYVADLVHAVAPSVRVTGFPDAGTYPVPPFGWLPVLVLEVRWHALSRMLP